MPYVTLVRARPLLAPLAVDQLQVQPRPRAIRRTSNRLPLDHKQAPTPFLPQDTHHDRRKALVAILKLRQALFADLAPTERAHLVVMRRSETVS